MRASDFDYTIDESLIATCPAEPRSSSRLLVCQHGKAIEHSSMRDFSSFLNARDLVVVNRSWVMPARFFARRKTGAELEGLYLPAAGASKVSAWLKGSVVVGERIQLLQGKEVEVLARDGKSVVLDLSADLFEGYLAEHGTIPVPPYIRKSRKKGADHQATDQVNYQVIFSDTQSEVKSVAAPTASLHFDSFLLNSLKTADVQLCSLELGVGLGTFEPLNDLEPLENQRLHKERVSIRPDVWNQIQETKKKGGRVIAVGTTVLRALESAAIRQEFEFETDLFIRPGFQFQIVDALLTNFHWPQTSLLVLVATFLERGQMELQHSWKSVYTEALNKKYRFYSYGDAMFIS